MFIPQQIPSLRDQVYDYLRDAILSGRLEPGRRIVERDIAAQMQISTTPVKEARWARQHPPTQRGACLRSGADVSLRGR